jgi:hypothetical protein
MKNVRMQHKNGERPEMAVGARPADALARIKATEPENNTYGQ